MPIRLLLAIIVLVVSPLLILGWSSARTLERQKEETRSQVDRLIQDRLLDFQQPIDRLFAEYEEKLSGLFRKDNRLESIESLGRRLPLIRLVMTVDQRGNILHPSNLGQFTGTLNSQESALESICRARPNLGSTTKDSPSKLESIPAFQWQIWYMDEGMQLIYWRIDPDSGLSYGFLLERPRWISDLTSVLPDSRTVMATKSASGRILKSSLSLPHATSAKTSTALISESGVAIYHWGNGREPDAAPLVTRRLATPLASWSLGYFADNPIANTNALPTILLLIAIGALLVSLAAYVLSGVQRQTRDAQSRVSFASQVSHELRTPLTNIRLYADLARRDLDKIHDFDEGELQSGPEAKANLRQRIGVIDTECQRLSRIVSGVLEIIREGGSQGRIRCEVVQPDQVVDAAIKQFEPRFAELGIQLDRRSNAGQPMKLDVDLVESVLVNLLSNVEKYAASGKFCLVHSEQTSNELIVLVADNGPGISARNRKRVFKPFQRLDHSISASSGTGIGLTIAKQLTERHGGTLSIRSGRLDLKLGNPDPRMSGSIFEMRIPLDEANKKS